MPDYQQQLLSLIEDSKEFSILHNHFNRFNPFKVLQVDNYEIRHSNVLAWLLDPKENHDLGSFFINKILAKTFVNPSNFEDEDKISNYDVLELSRREFFDLTVHKECLTKTGKRIDLLAVSNHHKIAMVIENKYWSSESEGQLEAYINDVRETYSGYQIIPIYLTLQNDEPTHEDYLMLGYEDILSILKNYLDMKVDYMQADIRSFLIYYVDILENQLIQNEEMVDNGLIVYRNHKDAVDLLYASGNTYIRHQVVDTSLAMELQDTESKELIQQIYLDNKETIDFIVKVGDSLLKEAFLLVAREKELASEQFDPHFKLPNFVENQWNGAYGRDDLRENWWLNQGLIGWFERKDDRLKLTIEVGPLHYDKRKRLLNALAFKGIAIKERALEEGAKFSRIYTSFETPASWNDKNNIALSMKKLLENPDYLALLEYIREAISLSKQDSPIIIDPISNDSMIGTPNNQTVMQRAFLQLVSRLNFEEHLYYVHRSVPNFIQSSWRELPEAYKVPRDYWLQAPFIAWFRNKNSSIRLIVEVGPIEHLYRVKVLERLALEGISIRAMGYEEGRKYTRIYSNSMPVQNSEDADQVFAAMEQLYQSPEFKQFLNKINKVIDNIKEE
ncbi:PD-(D/E)XK nuclease family protein [Psychrobacillus sp. NPDC058041]|uniref:PDDEXK-like family protein n=1 Tax=Psychrobacillus sp. NPDC058041 TaxID=3346310 RepID=UPI0036DC65DD